MSPKLACCLSHLNLLCPRLSATWVSSMLEIVLTLLPSRNLLNIVYNYLEAFFMRKQFFVFPGYPPRFPPAEPGGNTAALDNTYRRQHTHPVEPLPPHSRQLRHRDNTLHLPDAHHMFSADPFQKKENPVTKPPKQALRRTSVKYRETFFSLTHWL